MQWLYGFVRSKSDLETLRTLPDTIRRIDDRRSPDTMIVRLEGGLTQEAVHKTRALLLLESISLFRME